ncbi:MAG: DUF5107 domain-containing protein [Chloroflexota bacterium]
MNAWFNKTVLIASTLLAGLILGLALVLGPQTIAATTRPAGTADVYSTTLVINTYPYTNYLYDQHNPSYNISYKVLDRNAYRGSNPQPSARSYTLLVAENDYLKLTFLPELGGRLYQAIFKPTGHNELYQNPVIQPTDWGPPEQGWWLAAGGIEWGLPVEEHGYETGVPWSYETLKAADGVTVTLRDSTAPDRLRAVVSVYLPADRACFVIRPRIENTRGIPLDFKYWTNAMIAPGPANTVSADLRFVFPVNTVTVHSTGDSSLPGEGQPMSWPVYDGRDMSRLGNWRGWLGFFEHPTAQDDFSAVYDPAVDEGLVRIYPADQARGAKGFAFGWGADALPAYLWTNDGSYYVEMHGGLAPTFWDSATLPAGGSVEWQETWYPAAGIGGISVANHEAALYLETSGESVTIGAHSTAARPNSAIVVWQPGAASPLYHQTLPHLDPAHPYTASLMIGGSDDLALALLDAQDQLLALTGAEPESSPPLSRLTPLPAYVTDTHITLAWSAADDSAVLNYDLQVRDGPDGNWTDWLTRTTQTSAVYQAENHHTCFFRVRARDVLGNTESWRDATWGDTFTSVLLTPAAVLITSNKTSAGAILPPGHSVTYTLTVRNSGTLTASARLTDTLPASMRLLTETLDASLGTPLATDGHITWQAEVAAGSQATITYAMSPSAGVTLLTSITNTLILQGGLHSPFTRQATIYYGYPIWLPRIAKNG